MNGTCQCEACKVILHLSCCALHNEPAMPNGPCDCGAATTLQLRVALQAIAHQSPHPTSHDFGQDQYGFFDCMSAEDGYHLGIDVGRHEAAKVAREALNASGVLAT